MSSSNLNLSATPEQIEDVFSTSKIREQAKRMLALARSGKTNFKVHDDKIIEVAEFVASVTKSKYPDLNIPFHSRWGHFDVGNESRVERLNNLLKNESQIDRLKAKIDLVIVSVLLDAGAGPKWKYIESSSGKTFERSEGLAVASLHMFFSGAFSSDKLKPLQADADGLCQLTADSLALGFQVNDENPLAGFEGRLHLLQSLGKALKTDEEMFFDDKSFRPGNMISYLRKQANNDSLPAVKILRALQRGLGQIWPGRVTLNNQNMGDVWSYPPFGSGIDCLVPFHKLSQWLTYSLIEPCIEGGLTISDTNNLTGLAEYRNGGLFLDRGVLQLRDANKSQVAHPPASEMIVEWRALTVALLDEIAPHVRRILGKDESQFPLGKILEGGTWAAGRIAAQEKRAGGEPPLKLQSDGTVF